MISHSDILRLVERPRSDAGVLSLFLDMSVNSENKRTYAVFLNKQKSRFTELSSDRQAHHREAIGRLFARIQHWIETSFDEQNRGVACFGETRGDWFHAIQTPVPLANRLELGPYPVVAPLTELLDAYARFGVILVDRENLRLLHVALGRVREELSVRPEPYPASHDVQAGGYSSRDHQKRKAEEARQFFREFAQRIDEYDRRHRPDYYVLLGTTENTVRFREFLSESIQTRIAHTAPAPLEATSAEVVERLRPFFEEVQLREQAEVLDLVRDRVRNKHRAVAGVGAALEQLQEGKIDTLVIARNLEQRGAQCTRCGFYLIGAGRACPYCGGSVTDGIDLVESMIRLAAQQEVTLEFVDGAPMAEMAGVGALLRF